MFVLRFCKPPVASSNLVTSFLKDIGAIAFAVGAGEKRDRANKNECAEKLKAIAVKADGSSQVIGLPLGNFQIKFPHSTDLKAMQSRYI